MHLVFEMTYGTRVSRTFAVVSTNCIYTPKTPTPPLNPSNIQSASSTRAPRIKISTRFLLCYFFPSEMAIFLPPLSPRDGFRLTSFGLMTRFELRDNRSISSSWSSVSRCRFSRTGRSDGGLDDGGELDLAPLGSSEANVRDVTPTIPLVRGECF